MFRSTVFASDNPELDLLISNILEYVNENDGVSSLKLAKELKRDHQIIVGVLKSLECITDFIKHEPVNDTKIEITEEGKFFAENGSYEIHIFKAIPEEGLELPIVMKLPNAKFGFSKAMSAGWIEIDKTSEPNMVKKKVKEVTDTVHEHMKKIMLGEEVNLSNKEKQEYKRRKLIHEIVVKSVIVRKDKNFSVTLPDIETDLTAEMMATGSWKTMAFKEYNFAAMGAPVQTGYLHPLLKVKSEFRQVFLEMGFTEMSTNNYVESSFWNFDALFQPQQHPARDAHDTFFLDKPRLCRNFPKDYAERVGKMHSKGGYGSRGYNYEWKIEEAYKNVLRTHTTSVTARMLYKLAQREFRPMKLFSIDKVFRNETLDSTHLAEFHQVEGVIADYNLSLSNLIAIITEFFRKLGMPELEFKPAYNPYTEPSMEVFCYHPGLGKWIEIGNSGMFRPEMLLPMGLPEDMTVIAWGLSLERPTMIKYGFDNIRDLVGYKVDLNMVKKSPIYLNGIKYGFGC